MNGHLDDLPNTSAQTPDINWSCFGEHGAPTYADLDITTCEPAVVELEAVIPPYRHTWTGSEPRESRQFQSPDGRCVIDFGYEFPVRPGEFYLDTILHGIDVLKKNCTIHSGSYYLPTVETPLPFG